MRLIGVQELKLGNNAEAVATLQQAYRLALDLGAALPPVGLEATLFQLSLAHLRLGETQNCVLSHTSESCLFPIEGEGVHRHPMGSTQAVEHLLLLLGRGPGNLPARWILNIAYMTLGRYPDEVPAAHLIPPSAFESEEEFPRFAEIAPNLSLDVMSLAGGMITDDFDGDRLLDVMVSEWNPGGQLRYFRNRGDGRFDDHTEEAGLTGIYGGINIIQTDYDNDGDLDVFVMRGAWFGEAGRHPNSLLENDGQGRFTDVTFASGLAEIDFPTQTAAWADFDNDGDLDLYVGNETFPNQLFRNSGDGHFEDVAVQLGVDDRSFTKAVVWGDYDGDGLSDLYVSNLGSPNRLFHNRGADGFVDVAPDLGVHLPISSFPAWFWDFNNDGALDLYVASYVMEVGDIAADYLGLPVSAERDRLYQGDGKGGFREVSEEQNLHRVTQPMASNFGDLDNDGFLDFYLGTGYPAFEALMPNLMFRNRRGQGFSDVTKAGGFGHLQKGHGIAFADLDHDGDQDVVQEMGGWYAGDAFGNALFENPGFGNHFVVLELHGTRSNRAAIGTEIKLEIIENGARRSIHRWVNSGGTLGANPLRQPIGVGNATRLERVEIFWPATGDRQVFEDLAVDRFYEITEGRAEIRTLDYRSFDFARAGNPDHNHRS
ncbi:MAG: CRTAC1 family protein, partial [Vicinamibacteria bacterium]